MEIQVRFEFVGEVTVRVVMWTYCAGLDSVHFDYMGNARRTFLTDIGLSACGCSNVLYHMVFYGMPDCMCVRVTPYTNSRCVLMKTQYR